MDGRRVDACFVGYINVARTVCVQYVAQDDVGRYHNWIMCMNACRFRQVLCLFRCMCICICMCIIIIEIATTDTDTDGEGEGRTYVDERAFGQNCDRSPSSRFWTKLHNHEILPFFCIIKGDRSAIQNSGTTAEECICNDGIVVYLCPRFND